MVVQGFSPNWDSTQANEKYVLWMNKDDNNYYSLRWNGSGKWFRFSKMYNGSALAISPTSVLFSKNQINSLLIAQTSAGMVIKALLNNGTTVFSANTDTNLINGIVNLYFMVSTGGMALQADAFVQRFTLIDLDRMGWQDGIPDATAEQILRGTYHGFEFPVQTGTVKILPNNKYTLTGSGDLYIGGYKTRTVTTGDIITNDRENKIVLTDGSTIQLKM